MNKICTDVEQSKKLVELGIDVNTADMVYCIELYKEGWKYSNKAYPIDGTLGGDDIPAWSLTALLKLIPDFDMHKRTIECRIETTNHFIVKVCDLVDAAFEMVCWLLENKNI